MASWWTLFYASLNLALLLLPSPNICSPQVTAGNHRLYTFLKKPSPAEPPKFLTGCPPAFNRPLIIPIVELSRCVHRLVLLTSAFQICFPTPHHVLTHARPWSLLHMLTLSQSAPLWDIVTHFVTLLLASLCTTVSPESYRVKSSSLSFSTSSMCFFLHSLAASAYRVAMQAKLDWQESWHGIL